MPITYPCWEKFKGTDLHELLKKRTKFEDPSTKEGKMAYIKAAREIQQELLNNVDDIHDQIGFKKKQDEESDELPFGESKTTGIAHDIQQVRTFDTDSDAPVRGNGVSTEEAIKHGRDLLKDGKDPEKIADAFKQDPEKNISFDNLSVVRAQHENLVRETNNAEEKFGEQSKEYKEALAKENNWYNDIVKPMQTEWSKIGQAQQGEVDIDTGTYQGLKRALMQQTGKDITPKQSQEARVLSGKVKDLSTQVETLKQKLTDALSKGTSSEGEAKLTFEQKAKRVADRLRKLKTRPFTFKDENGNDIEFHKMGVAWNDLVELGAKTIEKTGKIADGIKAIIDKVKDEDWYKKLSDNDKQKFETKLSEHYGVGDDILTRFVDKKDNKFSNEDAKDIWEYAKENYLDKDADFDKMISGTAVDLGLKPEQVRDALTTPKGTREITDAMYKKQNERNMAIQRAKDWAKASKTNGLVKFFKSIPRFFFAAKVFGHGTVGMITHAGLNVYDPKEWVRYWPTFFKQFKFAYGKKADYEKAMQDLQNDPKFTFWKRNGLAVDPSERYDDYQFITKMFDKMGVVGKWLTAGDRGFNALKVYRLERAKAIWESLSNAEKADKDTPKEIAKLVNNSTGTTNLKVSEAAQTAFFAPNLELARWNKLIVNPVKAVKTFANWKNSSHAEKAAAKLVARRTGRILSTYVGALAVNQGLLSLSGSNQKINFTDPTQSDFLKFKAGGRTIDLTGGMISLFDFVARMVHIGTASKEELGKRGRTDQATSTTWNYVTGKLSPFGSTVKDAVTQHDFKGNPLPFSKDKPTSGKHTLSWKEYLENQQTPIPVAEYFNDLSTTMQKEGVPKPTVQNVLGSLFIAGLVGGTGAHIGEEPQSKPSPFTDEDKKDKRVSWIHDDWSMELPNTVASSENITDEDKETKIMLDKYPADVQEKYKKAHKEALFDILGDIHENEEVWVKGYKDENGEEKNSVKIPETSGQIKEAIDAGYEEKGLKKLSEDEKKKVLSEAQKMAATKTKKEIFNQ